MIAFRGGSENKALSRISEALGPGVTGYHCTWGFYRKLRSCLASPKKAKSRKRGEQKGKQGELVRKERIGEAGSCFRRGANNSAKGEEQ